MRGARGESERQWGFHHLVWGVFEARRGHASNGIYGTKPGELAVWCPACPHPSINLPLNWELAPEDKRQVSVLSFLAFI